MATALRYENRQFEEAQNLFKDCQSFSGIPQLLPQTDGTFTVVCFFEEDTTISPPSSAADDTPPPEVTAAPNTDDRRTTFLEGMEAELNKPYIWGADGPDAYDCSGFAQFALELLGKDPTGDQTAHMLFVHFSKAEHGRRLGALEPADLGDLVFYGTAESVSHVGVCINATEAIEAGGGGRDTRTVDDAVAQNANVRRVLISRRSDQVAIVRPNALPW